MGAAQRANYQLYLIELCEAIGVERPRPAATAGRIAEGLAYQFEFSVKTTARDGTISTNSVDLYKVDCFALEAKDAAEGSSTGKLLTKAFGQVANYAKDLAERPPYIVVLDVGKSLLVWDRWAGTYGGFHLGQQIDLRTLADNASAVALLRDIWTDPGKRDPRRYAQDITVEIAGLLAELSATLEARGHDAERVARFLIRCVFSMFAEDVKLLPDQSFKRLLDAMTGQTPAAFVQAAQALWRAMDGGEMFGYHRLLRFNGHFFANAEALPLERDELDLLRRAATADWSAVEPSIFGTLLVRALTAEERHRLGAEYTPRAFIERLVRPTVEEPVRERWTAVQAEVMQLRERARAADIKLAEKRLLDFHEWLRGLQILDPACGSGNFLYVTMHALKRVEVEVFRLLAETQGGQLGVRLAEIDPGQFHGIEVKAWAREMAELTLLKANTGLAMRGVQPQGEGFQLLPEEGERLANIDQNRDVVRPHMNGRDLAARSRNRYIIDFALMSEDDARRYPQVLNIVIDRVKPDRAANKRASYAKYWWRLGEPRPGLRAALAPLSHFIVTAETTAHRFFTLLRSGTSVDNSVIAVASDDPVVLGVLSSTIHSVWSSAAGTRLGVGNDERYNNPRCFDAFPFPDPPIALRSRIATLAESLDAHRKAAIARDERVTMTGMYNLVAKLRTNEPLTPKERAVHEIAACGILRDLHDQLDALVAQAYRWPWPMPDTEILDRLVALHDVGEGRFTAAGSY